MYTRNTGPASICLSLLAGVSCDHDGVTSRYTYFDPNTFRQYRFASSKSTVKEKLAQTEACREFAYIFRERVISFGSNIWACFSASCGTGPYVRPKGDDSLPKYVSASTDSQGFLLYTCKKTKTRRAISKRFTQGTCALQQAAAWRFVQALAEEGEK